MEQAEPVPFYDMWSHTNNGAALRNISITLPAHGIPSLLLNDAGAEPAISSRSVLVIGNALIKTELIVVIGVNLLMFVSGICMGGTLSSMAANLQHFDSSQTWPGPESDCSRLSSQSTARDEEGMSNTLPLVPLYLWF